MGETPEGREEITWGRFPTGLRFAGALPVLAVIALVERGSHVFTGYRAADLGNLVEYGPTNTIFVNPRLKETEAYVTGRFG